MNSVGDVSRAIVGDGDVIAQGALAGQRIGALDRAGFQIEGFDRCRFAFLVEVVGTDPQRLAFFIGEYAEHLVEAAGAGLYRFLGRGFAGRDAHDVAVAEAADDECSIGGGGDAFGINEGAGESDFGDSRGGGKGKRGRDERGRAECRLIEFVCHVRNGQSENGQVHLGTHGTCPTELQLDGNGLHFGVLLQAVLAQLAADAGLLESAEGARVSRML